jgi:hypothetical protein
MACTETDDNNNNTEANFFKVLQASLQPQDFRQNFAHIYYVDLPDVFLVLCTFQTLVYNHLCDLWLKNVALSP